MSDRLALVAGVNAESRDVRRLALADWLQERGDEPRAHFVRRSAHRTGRRPAPAPTHAE